MGSPGIVTPTAAGFATLSALPGVSATNLAVLKQFLTFNPASNTTLEVCRVNSVHGDCPDPNLAELLTKPNPSGRWDGEHPFSELLQAEPRGY